MKKLYAALFVLAALGSIAQSAIEWKDADNGDATVSHNQVFTKTTTANQPGVSHHFSLKNVSAATRTFVMVKFENTINSGAAAYFCFNTFCYTPGVPSATIALAAGASFSFYPKLDEGPSVGFSDVTFEFSDQNNGSDMVAIHLKYNPPAGLKEMAASFSNASSLYPNPTSGGSRFDVVASADMNGTLKIYNALGSVVATRQVRLEKGKNSVPVGSEELESGIYFVSFSGGNSKITKKLTVTN